MPENEEDWINCWRVKHKFMKDVAVIVQEYIEEAEHQDGPGYWTNYEDEEFLFDLATYIQNRRAQ